VGVKKFFLAAAFFLFFSPFVAQADTEGARSDLNDAANFASDAALYARRAYSTSVLEEAQYNARRAEKAVTDTQKAIQSAASNLGG
jgi:multidrug efflux pump subunit AcrA (membrane-fusion protein)